MIHETSSPYNSRSNGLAEAAVKNVKYLMIKCGNWKDFKKALSEWRNVPREDGSSPAQLLLGRRQRGALPTIRREAFDLEKAKSKRDIFDKEKLKKTNENLRPLKPLRMGCEVLIQDPKTRR
ncbi:Transposon Ty3-G Gag-Pol poly, partial [Paramuricea clavata]